MEMDTQNDLPSAQDPSKHNISATPLAESMLEPEQIVNMLKLHSAQEYGAVPLEVKLANDLAMYRGSGIVTSVYDIDGLMFLVMTQYGQTVTTVLTLEEAKKFGIWKQPETGQAETE